MIAKNSSSFFLTIIFFIACSDVSTNPKENATIDTIATIQPDQSPARIGEGANVLASLQDRKGNIWFATTNQGVYRYDGKSFTNFTTNDGLTSNVIFSITEDKKGNIWFGTDKAVSRYDGKIVTGIPGDPTVNTTVTCVMADKSGKLWLASNKGMYWYDGNVFTNFLEGTRVVNENKVTLMVVQQMLEDKHGNIWLTTKTDGVCRYDGKSIISYKPENELWFRGLLEDKKGTIWVGTRYRGAYRFDGKAFSKISLNDQLDSYTILSIIQDKSGNMWFGTEAGAESKRETEGGAWMYDGKSYKNFSTKDGLTQDAVWCILQDMSGSFWFGTRRGFCRYDGKTFSNF